MFEEMASGVSVERSVELGSPPDEVWRHIIDGRLLSEWMGGEVQITMRPGRSITLDPPRGERVWGTIEEVVDERRVQWSWRTDDGLPTLVEIELAPTGLRTILTVRETLLPWRVTGPERPEVVAPSPRWLLRLLAAA